MTLPALPAAVLALALAFSTYPGMASAPPDRTSGTGASTESQPLHPVPGDGELTAFVSAFVRLIGVQHGYMMMIQGESDPVRLAEMKRHAIEDMTAAVEKDGMSVERYNAIATALENDRTLQKRVEAILHQMASKPEEGDGAQ